jgi:hypothetical protein
MLDREFTPKLSNMLGTRLVGALAPHLVSVMGGVRRHTVIENELAPAIRRGFKKAEVDLALLVPY